MTEMNKYACFRKFIEKKFIKHIAQKVEHFKGDLHLFNLKQKLKGKPVISEEEFEKLGLDPE